MLTLNKKRNIIIFIAYIKRFVPSHRLKSRYSIYNPTLKSCYNVPGKQICYGYIYIYYNNYFVYTLNYVSMLYLASNIVVFINKYALQKPFIVYDISSRRIGPDWKNNLFQLLVI